MKKSIPFIITLLILFPSIKLCAQNPIRCGTVEYMARLKAEDPTLVDRLREAEMAIQRESLKHINERTSGTSATIYVPVVFHVMYSNTAENISDNRINDQIASLNKDFARLNADSNKTPSFWRSIAANTNIQFCLARRDPYGNPTNGVIRIPVGNGFDPYSNDNAKFTSLGGSDAWPLTKYLNIWTMSFRGATPTDLLGITTFPSAPDPHNDSLDGIIMKYSTIGGPNYHGTEPKYDVGRTLTHEVGHWLDLIHPWGDDSNGNATCEVATECNGSDQVPDTPNQGIETYDCPSYPQIDCCSSTPSGDPIHGKMFMNYMDYANDTCMNLFTIGQSNRMNYSITTLRPTIPNSLGCLVPNYIEEGQCIIFDLNVYPNPATGNITVSADFIGYTNTTIEISNMLGEIIYSKEMKNVAAVLLPVDLSGKARGVYILTLRTTGDCMNRKIILTR